MKKEIESIKSSNPSDLPSFLFKQQNLPDVEIIPLSYEKDVAGHVE